MVEIFFYCVAQLQQTAAAEGGTRAEASSPVADSRQRENG